MTVVHHSPGGDLEAAVELAARAVEIGRHAGPQTGRREGAGYGLCGLSSRVKQLGGELSPGMPEPGGTLAALRLPITRDPLIRAATPEAKTFLRRQCTISEAITARGHDQ
jgi:hypothetical protein